MRIWVETMPGVLTCDLSRDETRMRSPSRSRSDLSHPSSCTPSEPAEDMVPDRGGGGGEGGGSMSPSGGVFPRLSALASPVNLNVPQLAPRRISLNGLWDTGGVSGGGGGGGQKEERRHSHPTTSLSTSAASSELPIQIDFSFPVTELRVPDKDFYSSSNRAGSAGGSPHRSVEVVCAESVGSGSVPQGREAPEDPSQEANSFDGRKPHGCNISEVLYLASVDSEALFLADLFEAAWKPQTDHA